MTVRPWLNVRTSLPEDVIAPEDEDRLQPGHNITEIVADRLAGYGCEVSEPQWAGDNGWDLDVRLGKINIWVQVSAIEDYLILLKQNCKNRGAYGGWYPEYLDLLKRFAADMEADPRFWELRWFTQEEMDTRGAKGAEWPVVGSPPPPRPSLFQRLSSAWRGKGGG